MMEYSSQQSEFLLLVFFRKIEMKIKIELKEEDILEAIEFWLSSRKYKMVEAWLNATPSFDRGDIQTGYTVCATIEVEKLE